MGLPSRYKCFQVDLAYPTQIEGVRIFNWWSAGGSENGSTLGVNQFSVDIGVDINFTISSSKSKVFRSFHFALTYTAISDEGLLNAVFYKMKCTASINIATCLYL